MAMVNGTQVVTNKCRFNYVHVLEKYASKESNQEPMYSMCVLIPKSDTETLDAVNTAIDNAIDKNISKFGGKKPNKNSSSFHNPLRDGDTDRSDHPEYAGCYFINCKSQYKPRVVDRNKRPLETDEQIYSGMYGRVAINFFAFANSGNKGVGAGLGDIQKLEDGERLGGMMSIDALFGDSEGDDDNKLPF